MSQEAPRISIIGGGMITRIQLLPTVYQLQREGLLGDIHICALSAEPLKELQDDPMLLRAFPGQTFVPHPDPAKADADERFPELFKEILTEAPQGSIVVIAMPDQLHYGALDVALENDLHVCIVKPLVLKHAQAEEIASRAYQRGLIVGVEYHKRFDYRNLTARRAYRSGRFGEFRLGQAQMIEPYYYRDSNFQNWCTCQNSDMFTYVGCHYVDLVAFMTGLRPVVELMYSDFEYMAGDQLYNQAAKWHYMSGGQTNVPLVVRTSTGAGKGYGGQHSQALESHSTHTPGILVVYPSTPYDAKGLLKTSIRDDNPVVFVESQQLYNLKGKVPEEEYLVPFGQAAVRREGTDVTIVAWGLLANMMHEAADRLTAEYDVQAELIDPRTLVPLDMEAIAASVRKTGRCVVASQACRTGSYTAEVASQIEQAAFDYLDAPIERIGSADAISPQSEVLERAFLPGADDIVQAALRACYR